MTLKGGSELFFLCRIQALFCGKGSRFGDASFGEFNLRVRLGFGIGCERDFDGFVDVRLYPIQGITGQGAFGGKRNAGGCYEKECECGRDRALYPGL